MFKHLTLPISLLVIISLTACAALSVQNTAISNMATIPPVAHITATTTPTKATAEAMAEEAEVRALVADFGKRLQNVSLLSPDTVQQIEDQYTLLVAPSLLEKWLSNVLEAPGRVTSSPWPDRIEITTLSKKGSDHYEVTGFVVEITSTEIGSTKVSVKIPVEIVVEKIQGRWLIVVYQEKRITLSNQRLPDVQAGS